jgi:homocysteine S-methyltransferase
MTPIALSQLVRREVPIETIIHVCCRDRNLLALQMDLLSANALGLRNLMIITGDPPKMGIYPDATAVFDLDSIAWSAMSRCSTGGWILPGAL